jgi:uncharacterized membrane protein HdeD (DUF308 family)
MPPGHAVEYDDPYHDGYSDPYHDGYTADRVPVGAGLGPFALVRTLATVDPEVFVGLLGISAVLTGLLRILGGFAAEERLGRRWTLGGIVLGTLELALGALLVTSEVDPDLLVPIGAAWGAVSGILLLAQGLGLRRVAQTWQQASGTTPQDPWVAGVLCLIRP